MNKSTKAALVGLSFLGAAGGAAAADVTLTNFSSSAPDMFVIPDSDLVGTLFDLPLLNFTVTNGSVADTLSFTVNAAPNEVITEIIFAEAGSLSLDGIGGGAANGQITVNGISKTAGNFFVFSNGGNADFEFSNADDQANMFSFSVADSLTSVTVTLSNFLFAGANGLTGGTITKTAAQLMVVTAPIPLPPAVWMLGSAIVGLVTISRRKLAA